MIILLVIAVLIAIPLVMAFFLSDEYTIEREIVINKPRPLVFDYIRFVKNSENYSKWVMMDPAMKKDYRGTDGTTGFVYSWDSKNKNVGKGEQEITGIRPGERIDFELRFQKPFEGKSGAYMKTEDFTGGHTKVTWVFNGSRTYPMKIMHFLLNLKKMLGRDLSTGLSNLKTVLEKS